METDDVTITIDVVGGEATIKMEPSLPPQLLAWYLAEALLQGIVNADDVNGDVERARELALGAVNVHADELAGRGCECATLN